MRFMAFFMFKPFCRKKSKTPLLFSLLLILAITAGFFALPDFWRFHPFYPSTASHTWKSGELSGSGEFLPAGQGYSILIDLDQLVLTLYKDGEKFKSWPVSGGKKETPSPTGQWQVAGISRWGEGFGGSWLALNVPWGKYGIHGTVEPWFLGKKNVSHGCIRMKNGDVAQLKKYVTVGTPVFIKQDNAPFRILRDGRIGSDVMQLQEMLKILGYYNGGADGRFGRGTLTALHRFQKAENLKVDGVMGLESWQLLCRRSEEAKFRQAVEGLIKKRGKKHIHPARPPKQDAGSAAAGDGAKPLP